MQHIISKLPVARLHPHDGMAVTAGIWREAHAYHDAWQRGLAVLGHGSGILTGLKVVASDPADRSIYIEPGVGIDHDGNVIVVGKPVAFSLGSATGDLRIVLTHGETEPAATPNIAPGTAGDNALRVQSEFVVEALAQAPEGPHIELARVRRSSGTAAISNARSAVAPAANEIDLRQRRGLAQHRRAPARIGAVVLHGRQDVADALRALRPDCAVDALDKLDESVAHCDALAVFADASFTLKVDEMNALFSHLQRGGALYAEGAAAEKAYADLFESYGAQLAAVEAGHALLRAPHVFPARDGAGLKAGLCASGRAVLSTKPLVSAWAGDAATREEVRAASELGQNIWRWLLAES